MFVLRDKFLGCVFPGCLKLMVEILLPKEQGTSWSLCCSSNGRLFNACMLLHRRLVTQQTSRERYLGPEGDTQNDLCIQTTLASIMQSLGNVRTLSQCKCIHACLVSSELEQSMNFGSVLVQIYSNVGALDDARVLFTNLHGTNVSGWNFLIRAHVRYGQRKEALELFQQMCKEGLKADRVTFIHILSACSSQADLTRGRCEHNVIVSEGMESDVVVGTALVSMYGKCRNLKDAKSVFDNITMRNVVSWNAMIAAYAQNNGGREAIQLFHRMESEGVTAERATFVSVFSACASVADLHEGVRMHGKFLDIGIPCDVVIGNALVNMYGKCGSVHDAWWVFDKILERNVISWTCMIAACAQSGKTKEVLEHFDQMHQQGIIPNKQTFVNCLHACASQGAAMTGEQMHVYIVGSGLETDVLVGNALIHMHKKCGTLEAGWRLFHTMRERDVVTWTAMIAASVQQGHCKEALLLFDRMQQEGVLPDAVAITSILSACASQAALVRGEQIHACLVGGGLELDVVIGNALLSMYGRCGSLKDALKMFYKMCEQNVVSWNAMIAISVQHGTVMVAMQLFEEMQQRGQVPNDVTYINVLPACATQAGLAEGKRLHARIVGSGSDGSIVLGSVIVNMYGKCGYLKDAQRVFDTIPDHDVILWTNLIALYAQHRQGTQALQVFHQMQQEGAMPNKLTIVSVLDACASQANLAECQRMHACIVDSLQKDIIVGNALVSMYGHCSNLDDARRTFDSLPERDVISWTAMIAAYAQHGICEEALQLFDTMVQGGVMPDEILYGSIISACASQAALAEGKQMHTRIMESGLKQDDNIGNALVNLYGKCGSLEYAQQAFENIQNRDLFTWNTMIAAWAHHGKGKDTLLLFDKMQQEGIMPNDVTFVSILSACSHAGLVDEGCHQFNSMIVDHGITPVVDHYNCMVDLFGRVGRLDEAEELLKNMPSGPTLISLITLLASCRYQADAKRGERAANQVYELHADNTASYVMHSKLSLEACGAEGIL